MARKVLSPSFLAAKGAILMLWSINDLVMAGSSSEEDGVNFSKVFAKVTWVTFLLNGPHFDTNPIFFVTRGALNTIIDFY